MDNAAMHTPTNSPDGSQPEMSPAVAAALANAEGISDWIFKHHPGKVMETRNHRFAAPHFAACLEHREAALLLISQNMRASAFALWRPTYENYMRGHWALHVAGDNDFQKIAKTKALPKFDTVIKALDGKSGMFAKTRAKLWSPMSDFAHGGVDLVARWSGPDGIGSNLPDGEVRDLVVRLNTYGLLASMGINYMAGEHGLSESIFVEKVSAVLAGIKALP
jgi:hypothetical protein